jgi:energy-converting hydrogenase A subunit M
MNIRSYKTILLLEIIEKIIKIIKILDTLLRTKGVRDYDILELKEYSEFLNLNKQ